MCVAISASSPEDVYEDAVSAIVPERSADVEVEHDEDALVEEVEDTKPDARPKSSSSSSVVQPKAHPNVRPKIKIKTATHSTTNKATTTLSTTATATKKKQSVAAKVKAKVLANKNNLSLVSARVHQMAAAVDAHLLDVRKGCTLPDHNALNYPVIKAKKTGTRKAGYVFILTFGRPLMPSKKAFEAHLTQHAGGYSVLKVAPRPCAIKRETEDAAERESYVTPNQRKIADHIGKEITIRRKKCGLTAVNLKASKILAISEQIVAGTKYIFRLQLKDVKKITDVAIVTTVTPPGKTTVTDSTAIKEIKPAACELFPTTEVPIEGGKKKAKSIEEEYIDSLNAQQLAWEAGHHKAFGDLDFKEWADRFTGLKFEDKHNLPITTLVDDGSAMEASFDWRKKSAGCVNTARVRNQGGCGSCYAFSKTGVLSHRICIQSKGKKKLVLSTRYMVSCKYEGLNGCAGGFPRFSGKFLIDKGVPTERCVPYQADSTHTYCRHACKPHRLANGKVVRDPWLKYHAMDGSHARIVGERQMQLAIKAGGPIEGTMRVFASFKSYKAGVYAHPEPPRCQSASHLNCCMIYRYCERFHQYTFDKKTKTMKKTIKEIKQTSSGHAYMIVGWGEFPKKKGSYTSASKSKDFEDELDASLAETMFISRSVSPAAQRRLLSHMKTKASLKFAMAGKKFWICENSWGNDWAYGGFFFVERGIDTVGIESQGAYTLQPGHKVLFKRNSRCSCNAHGDLASKSVHILTKKEDKKAANKCKCDMGWGGDKCQTYCADATYKGSHFCTACTQGGSCTRCRSGMKANEKQALGDGKCWHRCKGIKGEQVRVGGVCGKDGNFPCLNSKTTAWEYSQNHKCACKPGFTGSRCQYPAKCWKKKGATCSSCTDPKACTTPSCATITGQYPPKCAPACSGNGFKVQRRYSSVCVCRDGYSGTIVN